MQNLNFDIENMITIVNIPIEIIDNLNKLERLYGAIYNNRYTFEEYVQSEFAIYNVDLLYGIDIEFKYMRPKLINLVKLLHKIFTQDLKENIFTNYNMIYKMKEIQANMEKIDELLSNSKISYTYFDKGEKKIKYKDIKKYDEEYWYKTANVVYGYHYDMIIFMFKFQLMKCRTDDMFDYISKSLDFKAMRRFTNYMNIYLKSTLENSLKYICNYKLYMNCKNIIKNVNFYDTSYLENEKDCDTFFIQVRKISELYKKYSVIETINEIKNSIIKYFSTYDYYCERKFSTISNCKKIKNELIEKAYLYNFLIKTVLDEKEVEEIKNKFK